MLVIFDCDGVLVDSESLAAQVFSEQLAIINIKKPPNQCFEQFKGHTLTACLNMLALESKTSIPSSFLESLKVATQKTFSTQLQAVNGVEVVLEALSQRKIPFCVASNGGYAKIQHSLKVTGLWTYFDGACFSAESVAQGKPAPDLFLKASKVMGYSPTVTTVIEDSEAGVEAAVSAGMRVLHYSQEALNLTRANPQYCDRVKAFTRMEQLVNLL